MCEIGKCQAIVRHRRIDDHLRGAWRFDIIRLLHQQAIECLPGIANTTGGKLRDALEIL